MPTILTALLTESLGPAYISSNTRFTAAGLLAYTMERYGPAYPALKPRIIKTLLKALVEDERTLHMRFGALCGFEQLGPPVIRSTLLKENASGSSNLQVLGRQLDARAQADQGQVEACVAKILVSCLELNPPHGVCHPSSRAQRSSHFAGVHLGCHGPSGTNATPAGVRYSTFSAYRTLWYDHRQRTERQPVSCRWLRSHEGQQYAGRLNNVKMFYFCLSVLSVLWMRAKPDLLHCVARAPLSCSLCITRPLRSYIRG